MKYFASFFIPYFFVFFLTGHYCPRGSPSPIRCISGEYQDEVGQSSCKDCPTGFFCDSTMEPVVLYNDSFCPQGKA